MAKLHCIALTKGQDVMTALHDYMMDKDWKGGVIVAGVGSVYGVTIGNPGSFDMPPKMLETTVNEPCEIVTFMGEITKKNEELLKTLPCQVTQAATSNYIIHIHAGFSHGDKGTVVAGGFRKATVLRAINVYVLEME